MNKAAEASSGFIFSGALWRAFIVLIWLMMILGNLLVFMNIVYGWEDNDGILISMSSFAAVFCATMLSCSIDEFFTHYNAIRVLPVSKTNALKACINKTMLYYLIPYAVIIPAEFFMAWEHGILKILTSVCLSADIAAITGLLYCSGFLLKKSKNKKDSVAVYPLIYMGVYLLYGFKGFNDILIFENQGNIAELIFAFGSAVITVLLFFKVRDTVAEKFE